MKNKISLIQLWKPVCYMCLIMIPMFREFYNVNYSVTDLEFVKWRVVYPLTELVAAVAIKTNYKCQIGSRGMTGLELFKCLLKPERFLFLQLKPRLLNTMWQHESPAMTLCLSSLWHDNLAAQSGEETKLNQNTSHLMCPTCWARSSACRSQSWLCNSQTPWERNSEIRSG